MTRKPPSNVREIIDLVVRRKWWIIACVLIVPPLVFVVGWYLPKQYRSETMIMVDQQRVPAEYVKATVTGDVTDRLQTISEEVMSRTRLLTIANKDNLYGKIREKYGDDVALAAMRKDITVDIIKGANDRSPIDGFKIAFIATTPKMAQRVTQQIADLFIQENVKERDQDAESTEQFIGNALVQARADLAAQDAKIRDFKATHLGSLPEQESANLAMIGEYQGLAQSNSEAIDRANQQRVYLQSMLDADRAAKQQSGSTTTLTPLQLQLQTAENQLAAARQKYTESYPDVIRLRDEVATLQAEAKQPAKASGLSLPKPAPNQSQQQIESQLLATQDEITSRTSRQHALEAQLVAIQSRVQSVPAVQQQFESLSRDYSEMQKNYESLLEKEQASGMAADLEKRDESERFRMLDPASLPSSPYSPNLTLLNAGGVAGSLLLGIALAFMAEMSDLTIHNSDEAEFYLSVPLIVTLPSLDMKKATAAST
ncbi:MAG: Wzz/FepE/Etk N-terminal domain-containing protein [Silvibacterium sp.]